LTFRFAIGLAGFSVLQITQLAQADTLDIKQALEAHEFNFVENCYFIFL